MVLYDGDGKLSRFTGYSRELVEAVTGLTRRQILHWIRLGVVTPTGHVGKGGCDHGHVFTIDDVAVIAAAKRLRDQGLGTPQIKEALAVVRSKVVEGWVGHVLVADPVLGKYRILATARTHKAIAGKEACIVVNLEKVGDDVTERLEALELEKAESEVEFAAAVDRQKAPRSRKGASRKRKRKRSP